MNNDTAVSGFILALAAIGMLLLILCIPTAAAARDVCLTKKEARELWPKRHIYWYSKDRCWSNRRGPPRGLKFDPVQNNTAKTAVKTVRASEFNELDALAPNSSGPIIMFPELTDKLDALTRWWNERWGASK